MNPGSNWVRRHLPHSPRRCARPGCGAPATATLRFPPTSREAWLVDLDYRAPRTHGDLCVTHAEKIDLPRGFALTDQRQAPVIDLSGRPPAMPVVVFESEPEPAVSITTPEIEIEEVEIEEVGIEEVAFEIEFEVIEIAEDVEDEVVDVELTVDGDSDADGELAQMLDARTPLLRRAFGNVQLPD